MLTSYGAMNEHMLGVAESTCAAKPWPDEQPNAGLLSIVDLSRLVLERARLQWQGVYGLLLHRGQMQLRGWLEWANLCNTLLQRP